MHRKIFLALIFIFILWAVQSKADEIYQSVDFSSSDLIFSSSQGFDIIYLKGTEITDRVGEPQVPVKLVHISLPPGSVVEKVTVTRKEFEILPDEYRIYPAQPPQILSRKDESILFVQPEVKVYNLKEEYPGKLVEYTQCGFLGGYQLAGILVYPVQYIPSQRKVKFYQHIEFRIEYTSGGKTPLPVKKRSEPAKTLYRKAVDKKSLNPQRASLELKSQNLSLSLLPPGDYEYVIITDETFVSAFQPLADWKTKKGLPTTIVTTDWIYSSYSGYDNAESIRNFIQDAYQNWGTAWVLLGGDNNVVPDRACWAMDCEYGAYYDENDIRCDLYFSDMDGTWDADGDHIYGEVEDSVDMYADVFVGRASCSTISKAEALVSKLLTYQIGPPTDYQTDMLFCAEILWTNPYTNSGVAKDLIDEKYVPSQFDPITKLYEDLGNESTSSVLAAMNQGQNMINHDGHASYSLMGAGSGYLRKSDMDGLTNDPRNSILFSIGCWPAAFDYDCIAEHFINNPNGGGVAFIGNSRYGWGSPGNPEYGYSDRYDREFYGALFSRDFHHIGAAVADMKAYFVPFSQQENVYRWCMYEVNLLGEPEMPIWTDTPEYLTVDYPDTIPEGTSYFTVTVSRDGGIEPVTQALVCVMKGGQVYQRGLTDSQGQIGFEISPSSGGVLYVTATAHNYLPHQDSVWVVDDGPFVQYQSHQTDDASGGNGSGLVNPGETIGLSLTLKNFGSEAAYDLYAVLRSQDPNLNLIDSLQEFGTIDPGDSATSYGNYSFSVVPGCPNDHVIILELEINTGDGSLWESKFAVTVVTPLLEYRSYTANDLSGNTNGIPDPDETIDLNVLVKNQGEELASGVTGILSTSNTYIQINDSTASFGDISSEGFSYKTFEVYILPDCPDSNFPCLHLRTSTDDGYAFEDSFVLTIGEPGFEDDMESGDGNWTHGGTEDLWHLSSNRKNSGDWSWYNGLEDSWYFYDNTDSWLESSPFILGPDYHLFFWLWYDVTNYGVDGIYVQLVNTSTGAVDTFDFIGTGGALDTSLNTGNDWLEYSYDLSSIPPGTTIKIRFSFASDGAYTYEGEGFYLDDVRIGPPAGSSPGDVNCDGKVDLADPIFVANYLLKGGPSPDPLESADVDCDGDIDIGDIIYLANYLLKSGPPPCQ